MMALRNPDDDRKSVAIFASLGAAAVFASDNDFIAAAGAGDTATS
jgi:hypothetical protein